MADDEPLPPLTVPEIVGLFQSTDAEERLDGLIGLAETFVRSVPRSAQGQTVVSTKVLGMCSAIKYWGLFSGIIGTTTCPLPKLFKGPGRMRF